MHSSWSEEQNALSQLTQSRCVSLSQRLRKEANPSAWTRYRFNRNWPFTIHGCIQSCAVISTPCLSWSWSLSVRICHTISAVPYLLNHVLVSSPLGLPLAIVLLLPTVSWTSALSEGSRSYCSIPKNQTQSVSVRQRGTSVYPSGVQLLTYQAQSEHPLQSAQWPVGTQLRVNLCTVVYLNYWLSVSGFHTLLLLGLAANTVLAPRSKRQIVRLWTCLCCSLGSFGCDSGFCGLAVRSVVSGSTFSGSNGSANTVIPVQLNVMSMSGSSRSSGMSSRLQGLTYILSFQSK